MLNIISQNREIQSKTTRYYFTPTRVITKKIKQTKMKNNKGGEDIEKLLIEPLDIAGGNSKWFSHYGFGNSSEINIKLPYDPTILLLDIYPK